MNGSGGRARERQRKSVLHKFSLGQFSQVNLIYLVVSSIVQAPAETDTHEMSCVVLIEVEHRQPRLIPKLSLNLFCLYDYVPLPCTLFLISYFRKSLPLQFFSLHIDINGPEFRPIKPLDYFYIFFFVHLHFSPLHTFDIYE